MNFHIIRPPLEIPGEAKAAASIPVCVSPLSVAPPGKRYFRLTATERPPS